MATIKAKATHAVAVAKALTPTLTDGIKIGMYWGGVRLGVTAVVVLTVGGVNLVGRTLFGDKAA